MHTLRLVKSYRGYKAGEVIKATPGLSKTLQESGIAVLDGQASLPGAARAERAVAFKVEARQSIETR